MEMGSHGVKLGINKTKKSKRLSNWINFTELKADLGYY